MPDDFTSEQTSEEGNEDPFGNLSDYGRAYISKIEDEQERALVANHIKNWDAGATKKFQEYSEKLKGYETLGSPDQLQLAMNIVQNLERDPYDVIQRLIEANYVDPSHFTGGQPSQQEVNDEIPSWFTEQFSPVQEKLGKLDQIEQALGQLAQNYQQINQERQRAQEEQQLNQVLGQLQKDFPGIPERSLLAYLQTGAFEDPREAAKSVMADLAEMAKRPPAPNVMGPGGVPKMGKSPTEMTPQEAKEYAVNFLKSVKAQ